MKNRSYNCALFMKEHDMYFKCKCYSQKMHLMGQASYLTTSVSIQTKFILFVFRKEHIYGHEGY